MAQSATLMLSAYLIHLTCCLKSCNFNVFLLDLFWLFFTSQTRQESRTEKTNSKRYRSWGKLYDIFFYKKKRSFKYGRRKGEFDWIQNLYLPNWNFLGLNLNQILWNLTEFSMESDRISFKNWLIFFIFDFQKYSIIPTTELGWTYDGLFSTEFDRTLGDDLLSLCKID